MLAIRRIIGHPSFLIGGLFTVLLIGTALMSLVWTPHPATEIDVARRLTPPSANFLLGTDQLGRDILSMLMVGARNSILVGLISVGIGLSFGASLGLASSAIGGAFEEAVMRICDFGFAFPAILLAIMLAASFGPSLFISIVAIGIVNVPIFARITRAAANTIWVRDYILASRLSGKGRTWITVHHVVPNISAVLVVQATIQFAGAILAEAALSYLGLGTQPPHPSWGRMLNEAQTLLFMAPEFAIFPGIAIAMSVLGLNLLGDGLRDLTDPRLSRMR